MSRAAHLVLTLDLGATNFRVALVKADGEVLRQHRDSTNSDSGPEQGMRRIKEAARDMLSDIDRSPVLGMGVAAAGLIDPDGVLLTSPNLLTWYNTPLKQMLERDLGVTVRVGNDANLAALGERRFGAGRGCDDLVYLTVSTGIGGGVITGGRLLVGSRGFAAELGHMTIDVNGPRCNCGNVGCLEVMASGTAIARFARERLSRGDVSTISEMVSGDLNRVTAQTVAEAAESGDQVAREIVQTAATNLGAGVVSLVHIFNPQVVIIGGGVSRAGDLIFEPVRRVVAERVMRDIDVRIVPAALGDDSGLLGAAALVLDSMSY